MKAQFCVLTLAMFSSVESVETTAANMETAATAPSEDPVLDSDFIVPIANDLRFGYSANIGNYHRSQSTGEGTDNGFAEHGLWASYLFAITRPGRALSGQAEWRAEIGFILSLADISNSNGSTGALTTATLDLGIGPAWGIAETDSSRLEIEVMPFVGIGLSRYENDYATDVGAYRGQTSLSASGFGWEYGLKANLMWCWNNGWGAALHAGFVQRVTGLDGDSTTHWSNGQIIPSDYTSDDILTGMRFGLFVAKRL